MQLFGQKDARIGELDFMFRATFLNTYSAIDGVSGPGFGSYSFRRNQARELCGDLTLNRALRWIPDSKFSKLFSVLVS